MIPPIAGPWILAQMNVSRLREPIDAPRLLPFVERIAAVNALADAAPGFLWREEDGTGPGNLGHRPFGDEVIYNLSLWRDVESLAAFTYGPEHRVVMQDRDDWFLPAAGVTYVLWWVPAGHRPTAAEGELRLAQRAEHGDTAAAFSLQQPFPAPVTATLPGTRLNKWLAETGVCSRREADAWIANGRIVINGQPAVLGTRVQEGDSVSVDGLPAQAVRRKIYLALHKPVGIECTTDRRVLGNIVDFVGHHERVFPIGRLDKDSEGLILLTNDGNIVNDLLRAEHGHEKEYLVEVDRPLTPAFLEALAQGVPILDTVTLPCRTWMVGKNTFGMVLTQGLNRQIRRMCEHFDYTVRRLRRVRIVNIELGALPQGRWRELSAVELAGLLPAHFGSGMPAAAARVTLKPRRTPSSRPRG